MTTLDKRLNAFRDDLADERLRGKVEASNFVKGTPRQVAAPVVNVHRAPDPAAMQLTQALMGESVHVFHEKDGWAWVQLEQDRYVGYVQSHTLSADVRPLTHRVWRRSTLAYPKADLKSQPVLFLPLNARFAAVNETNGFLETAAGLHIYAAHCCAIDRHEPDFVDVAEGFAGVPYLWGGKSATGLDCSGLVQVAMEASGLRCPRDTDMQERDVGQALRINDLDGLRRGDLVFWKGHVGIMTDAEHLLHANGYHMLVVREPLKDAVSRIDATGVQVSSFRRI